uniref:DUF4817 domain-containing protein n=1 Tax=Anoplophora glabripennis TaxID=217634 RepID=V5GM36_ANOGL
MLICWQSDKTMAHVYSNNELVDMLLVYGECRRYAQKFPRRFHPSARFVYLTQRARDTGKLQENRGNHAGRARPLRMMQAEEEILDIVEENPTTSTRKISHQVNVSQSKVWQTFREKQLYPFHIQRAHALLPEDHPKRVQFCEWLLQQNNASENFTRRILATDEATFTRNGINNFHNTHIWAVENRHEIRRTNFQQRFSLNVWAGIVAGKLVGPAILPDRLTGLDYLHFLQNNLPELLEEIPLHICQNMWYLHDGAPPHFRCEMQSIN